MKHQAYIYYKLCSKGQQHHSAYHMEQRNVVDNILKEDLRKRFDVEFEQENIVKGKYGKPYFKDMTQYHYNVSNTNGMVVCVISDIAVGVDTEKIKPFHMAVLKKSCNQKEQDYVLQTQDQIEQAKRFMGLWTLKESYIKMIGQGLYFPLQEITFEQKADEIYASQEGFFTQRQVGEYWISVCGKEELEVIWMEVS